MLHALFKKQGHIRKIVGAGVKAGVQFAQGQAKFAHVGKAVVAGNHVNCVGNLVNVNLFTGNSAYR